MRKNILIIMVLAMVLVFPVAMRAQEDPEPMARGMRGLGLDKDQMEKLEKLRMAHQLAMIDLRAEQKKLRLEMRMELGGNDPNEAALMRIVEKIGALRDKMAKQRIEHLLGVRKILNDEQWEKFIQRHRDGMERRGMGRGKMGRGLRGMRGGRGCRGLYGERGMLGCEGLGPRHGRHPLGDRGGLSGCGLRCM